MAVEPEVAGANVRLEIPSMPSWTEKETNDSRYAPFFHRAMPVLSASSLLFVIIFSVTNSCQASKRLNILEQQANSTNERLESIVQALTGAKETHERETDVTEKGFKGIQEALICKHQRKPYSTDVKAHVSNRSLISARSTGASPGSESQISAPAEVVPTLLEGEEPTLEGEEPTVVLAGVRSASPFDQSALPHWSTVPEPGEADSLRHQAMTPREKYAIAGADRSGPRLKQDLGTALPVALHDLQDFLEAVHALAQ